MFPTVRKDVISTKQQSMVVYQYVCRCDCRYVGRTSQRLQDRIKQHIPKAIRNQAQPNRNLFQSNHTSTSAIGQHLLNNEKCASHYDDNQSSILAKGRTLFHLSTLEATFIKILQPSFVARKNSSTHKNYVIDSDSTKRLVVYKSERSDIFTSCFRYKYLAINTRLHSSDNS